MSDLYASGRIVDLILALVALEAVVLIGRRRRSGSGLEWPDILLCLSPGVVLLLALRAALTGQGWPGIALCLALAGAAHAADLRRRMARG